MVCHGHAFGLSTGSQGGCQQLGCRAEAHQGRTRRLTVPPGSPGRRGRRRAGRLPRQWRGWWSTAGVRVRLRWGSASPGTPPPATALAASPFPVLAVGRAAGTVCCSWGRAAPADAFQPPRRHRLRRPRIPFQLADVGLGAGFKALLRVDFVVEAHVGGAVGLHRHPHRQPRTTMRSNHQLLELIRDRRPA